MSEIQGDVRWTSVPPTEAGWYWWRANNASAPHVTCVYSIHDCFWVRIGLRVLNIGHTSGQWWPIPIEPPKENAI